MSKHTTNPHYSTLTVTLSTNDGPLFWLVKQYCGATLNETFKYYTTATFIASVLALGGTFLLSFII